LADTVGPFSVVAIESDPTWDVPEEEMRNAGTTAVKPVPPAPITPSANTG
jgi:hypothetical protein